MAEGLRAALIGYGLAGRVIHRPLLDGSNGLTVTHVVTSDQERRRQAAADLPGARLLDDADALWRAADDVDVVVIVTTNPTHVPLATKALELGKPTVVDKPMALSSEDARGLCERARALGVPLSVFHNRRWDSDTLAGSALIAAGTLGDLVRLESRFARFRPQVVDRWREDAAAGGGVLLDLGTHVVDQAMFLLGPVTQVYAEVDTRRAGARADDDCFVALTHVSGVRSHLWCSMAAPVNGPRLLLQGSRAGWVKQQLDGQEDAQRAGAVLASEPAGRLFDAQGERDIASPLGDWGDFYRRFAVAVLADGPLPVEPEDAVEVLRVLEAARTSSQQRRVIPLA